MFDIDPVPGTGYTTAPHVVLDSATVQSQINFHYGPTTAWYRVSHPGGPFLLHLEAEHAGPDPAEFLIQFRNASTSLLDEETVVAGGNSTPLPIDVDFGTRPAGTYYVEITGGPCGLSYAFNCNDDDGDGTCNFYDHCPGGPEPGTPCDDGSACTGNDIIGMDCNCAGTFQDIDEDGTCDADDGCPNDPNKIAPGNCGCGNPEPGATCNDGNPLTENDMVNAACECAGTPIITWDCPALEANIGDACDDQNAMTENDTVNEACECVGTPIITWDCPVLEANIGDACDDNNAQTDNDTINEACECVGTPIITWDCPVLEANFGDACDDNNAQTENDTINEACECVGTPIITWDCPVLEANIGDACDDNNAQTEHDMVNAACECAGTPIITWDCPLIEANIGDACNDGNPATINDTVNDQCACVGTPTDCTQNLVLAITLDEFGSQTTWEFQDDQFNIVASGGPYTDGAAGSVVEEDICVPVGCYHLVVNDDAGNGISAGGYVLTDANGRRVVDASGNFGEASQVLGGPSADIPQAFCLPLSGARMLPGLCDKPSRSIALPVYASTYPGATMYQYWIFDPHGSYNRKVAYNSTQFVPGNLVTLPVPTNVDLNICVRPMVGGSYLPFGGVCKYRFVPHHAANGSLSSMAGETTIALFPNPNRTRVVNLSFSGVRAHGTNIVVEIFDAFGKQAHTEQFPAAEEAFNQVLQLDGGLAAGLYTVNITVDGQRSAHRLVLE